MKNKALTCFLSVVGALLISATNGFSESSFGTVVNNACAPVIVYTGSCTLCHLADRSASTPAKTAYLAGGTTLTNFFCPSAPPPVCTDNDGDTYAVEGGTCGQVDCNDANAAVNPAAAENCTDGIDNNCNGQIDAQDPAAVGCPVLAPDINLNPATLTFGSVLIGDSSARNAVIQNLGTAALVVNAIAPAGGTTEFSFTAPGTPFSIPAGGNQTVTVTYQPLDAGTDNGALVISSNDPNEQTVSVTLSGTGNAVPSPNIVINPATLTFGSVLIGDSSAQDTVIQNLGTAALVVNAISPAGGTSTEFSFTAPGTPFSIPAGGNQTVTVTYQPLDAGTDNGTLVISSDDPDEPTVSVTLSANGDAVPTPDIDISSSTLGFTAVMVGKESLQTLIVQNLGTADVTINAMDRCPETSSEFSWAPAAPFTLLPKTSMTLSVMYAPLDVGTDTGCLSIASDDPDEATVEIGLQAAGVLTKTSILRFLSPILNAAGRQNR
jgi:hypothetical protein